MFRESELSPNQWVNQHFLRISKKWRISKNPKIPLVDKSEREQQTACDALTRRLLLVTHRTLAADKSKSVVRGAMLRGLPRAPQDFPSFFSWYSRLRMSQPLSG